MHEGQEPFVEHGGQEWEAGLDLGDELLAEGGVGAHGFAAAIVLEEGAPGLEEPRANLGSGLGHLAQGEEEEAILGDEAAPAALGYDEHLGQPPFLGLDAAIPETGLDLLLAGDADEGQALRVLEAEDIVERKVVGRLPEPASRHLSAASRSMRRWALPR